MSLRRSINSVARSFGIRLSKAGSVERLENSVNSLSSELRAARKELGEARSKQAQSWFGSSLEEVEKRYSRENGSFLEPDGVTHTFTNMEMESARLLYSLILLNRPNVVVETGTHQGYSATYVAAALRDGVIDGKIWTIDPFQVSHLWDNTPLDMYVEWVKEMSFDALDRTPENIDFLILDSLHTFDTLAEEVRIYEPRLKVGGVLFLHDTLVFPEMAPVVDAITDSGRFDAITLNTPRKYQLIAGGSGITVAVKTSSGAAIDASPYKIRGRTTRDHFDKRDDYFAKQVMANSRKADLDTYLE